MKTTKIVDSLITGAEFFSSLCLFLISALVIAQVIMRYVANYPFTWSEELTTIAFIYLTFSGIGVAYAKRRHLYVDALIAILPNSVVKIINILVLCLSSIFLIIVAEEMIRLMIVTSRMDTTTAALQLPVFLVYLALPIGCLLFLTQIVRRFHSPGGK